MSLWERQTNPKESPRAYEAFSIYLDLGPVRSLEKVGQRCSKSVSLLARWSTKFSWVKRAEAYDRHLFDVNELARDAEIKKIMAEGFANTHERVKALNELAIKLQGELKDTDKLWLKDIKAVGQGEFTKYVDLVRFNASLIEQFRATLDDLAKETGGRIKKTAATVTLLPKQYIGLEELEAEADEDE